jgi:hypothetical protein
MLAKVKANPKHPAVDYCGFLDEYTREAKFKFTALTTGRQGQWLSSPRRVPLQCRPVRSEACSCAAKSTQLPGSYKSAPDS